MIPHWRESCHSSGSVLDLRYQREEERPARVPLQGACMFTENVYWEKIQSFLPEHNRISEKAGPVEKWYTLGGSEIRYDEYSPERESAVSVVALHGVGGNGRLLSFMAVPLVKAGFNVICPDLPGYGYTKPAGDFDYSAWIDTGTLVARKEIEKGRKVILFGLSAGGMLAYNVACRLGNAAGLIVTNILDNRYQIVRDYSAKNRFHSRVGIPLLGMLPDALKRIKIPVKSVANMRKIVNHRELLKIMLRDSAGSGSSVSIKFLLSMMNMVPLTEPEDFAVCPVLMAHPGNDEWTPVDISRLFFDRLTNRKELVILDDAGHFPFSQPGIGQLEEACITFIRANT